MLHASTRRWLFPVLLAHCSVVGATSQQQPFLGELDVLRDYAEPALKSGHDALRPLTDTLQGYFAFKDTLKAKHGLSYVIEYSPQYQWLPQQSGIDHGNDETNFIMQWSPIDPENGRAGSLFAWYQISTTLGNKNTSEFMQQGGVITPINGGDTAPGDYRDLWQMLVWEQWFQEEKLRVGVGKLTTRTFLNLNRYAVSDREDFFNPMLVNNPVAPFSARNGMGIYSQYFFADAYLTGMLREADGTSEDISFDTLDSGKWEAAIELGLTPSLEGYGLGNYRITTYYTDAIGRGASGQPSGWSLALSFDQDIGDKYGLLFRYAWASENFRAFKQRMAAGMQWRRPLNFKNDRIGLAAWWGDPTDSTLDAEYGIEAFWKLQLSPYLEVGPDLQLVFNPQGNTNDDPVAVAGLRIRLVM